MTVNDEIMDHMQCYVCRATQLRRAHSSDPESCDSDVILWSSWAKVSLRLHEMNGVSLANVLDYQFQTLSLHASFDEGLLACLATCSYGTRQVQSFPPHAASAR
jgi:hypothetical protein